MVTVAVTVTVTALASLGGAPPLLDHWWTTTAGPLLDHHSWTTTAGPLDHSWTTGAWPLSEHLAGRADVEGRVLLDAERPERDGLVPLWPVVGIAGVPATTGSGRSGGLQRSCYQQMSGGILVSYGCRVSRGEVCT